MYRNSFITKEGGECVCGVMGEEHDHISVNRMQGKCRAYIVFHAIVRML